MNPIEGTQFHISFYTTAMGRRDQVEQTLLENIAANRDFPNVEFILLDYASQDALGEWVRSNALDLIQAGKLVYLRHDGAEYYNSSHAKNICCLAATGDILCNVDADNFIPAGFAFHLHERMSLHPRAVAYFETPSPGTGGRLAAFRGDVFQVGGYNEAFVGWGYDDIDLRLRLHRNGCNPYFIDEKYAAALQHADERRVANFPPLGRQRRATNRRNRQLSFANLRERNLVANLGSAWGAARLTKNFTELIEVGARATVS